MGRRHSAAIQPEWTWADLLAYFRQNFGPLSTYEHGYVPWLRSSPNFGTAVDRAVLSRYPNGKMHNHQSKVRLVCRVQFGALIKAHYARNPKPKKFHDLWLTLDELKPWGIGELTVYDVAERIGRFLDLTPDRVYLHAGVRSGAKALGIETRNKSWLLLAELPEAMCTLAGDEAEDFLCCFNPVLHFFKDKR